MSITFSNFNTSTFEFAAIIAPPAASPASSRASLATSDNPPKISLYYTCISAWSP